MSYAPFTQENAEAACTKHGLTFLGLEKNYRIRFRCPTHGELAYGASAIRDNGCQFCTGEAKNLYCHSMKTIVAGLEELGMQEPNLEFRSYEQRASGKQQMLEITFLCPTHGVQVRALSAIRNSLYRGTGVCIACNKKKHKKREYYTTASFKERVREINPRYTVVGPNFTFVKSDYRTICDKPNHGAFVTGGGRLLMGAGCPKCAEEKKRGARTASMLKR